MVTPPRRTLHVHLQPRLRLRIRLSNADITKNKWLVNKECIIIYRVPNERQNRVSTGWAVVNTNLHPLHKGMPDVPRMKPIHCQSVGNTRTPRYLNTLTCLPMHHPLILGQNVKPIPNTHTLPHSLTQSLISQFSICSFQSISTAKPSMPACMHASPSPDG